MVAIAGAALLALIRRRILLFDLCAAFFREMIG
jgi:hypothetical protein